jgi:hypothetical protein
MPDIDQAVKDYELDSYYDSALSLIVSGRAREAFDLRRETEGDARPVRSEYVRAELSCWHDGWSKLGRVSSRSFGRKSPTRTITLGTCILGLSGRMKNQAGPMLDAGLSALIADLDDRGSCWTRPWSWRSVNSDAAHSVG